MKRVWTFSVRTMKEIVRDPLNLAFGLGFPVTLLLLLSAIQASVPVSVFEIDALTPGITVFGLSFMTLFTANLVAKDRESAFLERLYTTPLTASDFILGYILPVLPVALAQSGICYLVALCLGLTPSANILLALLGILPLSLLFVGLGVLFGSILSVKAVGGICGALLTNLSAWFSGIWFDFELVGKGFATVARLLPFSHAVELEQGLLLGEFSGLLAHSCWVGGYALAIVALAVWLFLRQMKKN